MIPDPTEVKALEDAVEAFDLAYDGLRAQTMRVLRIAQAADLPTKSEASTSTATIKATGKFCPKCNGIKLREKGGGCLACLECGFDLGCNG